VLSYRVTLDAPFQLVAFVSGLLAAHRREIGTRDGTRALTCWKQAVFTLAWFRDRPDIRRLGQGFGISQATAYRYKDTAAVDRDLRGRWSYGGGCRDLVPAVTCRSRLPRNSPPPFRGLTCATSTETVLWVGGRQRGDRG
jgi:hypothetical protein